MRYVFLLFLFCVASFGQDRPCVFCQIAKGESAASVVYKDDQLMAFMDHAPINPGHVLIIPIKHAEHLLEMPEKTVGEMMVLAQKIGQAMKRTDLEAQAIQLRMNNGRPIQGLLHAHLHVYPRFAGDGGEKLDIERPRAARAELDAVAKKIKAALDETPD